MQHLVLKKVCMAVSPWTGEKCKAKAVGENTLKRGTRDFLDSRFCQMHQPGVESRKKCVCPHCNYHRSKDKNPMIQIDDKTGNVLVRNLQMEEEGVKFGKTGKKKKVTLTKR